MSPPIRPIWRNISTPPATRMRSPPGRSSTASFNTRARRSPRRDDRGRAGEVVEHRPARGRVRDHRPSCPAPAVHSRRSPTAALSMSRRERLWAGSSGSLIAQLRRTEADGHQPEQLLSRAVRAASSMTPRTRPAVLAGLASPN